MTEFIQFPENFIWGTSTASYQIEGAVHEDGRKDSIWDVFSHTPGKVDNGHTGDIADDHYHRWKEDVSLMKELGYKAYRFSLAWPRIVPDGKGKVNQKGIDFYNRLIDELLSAGIHPLVTLYHWDLPAALPGGWVNRETSFAFGEFSSIVAKAFGDRVKEWITINEPFCASFLSYKYGKHAPGLKDGYKAMVASHHLLLAHSLAIEAVRAEFKEVRIGITLNEGPYYPATQSQADLDAARYGDGELNRWFLDPIFGRYYPADILQDSIRKAVLKSYDPDFILAGDMQKIAVPIDFLAINNYTRSVVHSSEEDSVSPRPDHHPNSNHTEMGWEVFPYGIYETICRAYFTYKPKEIIISENGASYSDGPDPSGKIHDERRITYLRSYIAAVGRAIQAGVPVTGYYVWSLLDNFEWSFGYAQRFGLIYVDYKTQKRYPKDSALWYSDLIRNNGLEIS